MLMLTTCKLSLSWNQDPVDQPFSLIVIHHSQLELSSRFILYFDRCITHTIRAQPPCGQAGLQSRIQSWIPIQLALEVRFFLPCLRQNSEQWLMYLRANVELAIFSTRNRDWAELYCSSDCWGFSSAHPHPKFLQKRGSIVQIDSLLWAISSHSVSNGPNM